MDLTFDQNPQTLTRVLSELAEIKQLITGQSVTPPTKKKLSLRQAVIKYGKSEAFFYHKTSNHLIPFYRESEGKGRLYFIESELDAWFANHSKRFDVATINQDSDAELQQSIIDSKVREFLKGA
jgi:predicted DNA-binding transcriptional regulator AlpA